MKKVVLFLISFLSFVMISNASIVEESVLDKSISSNKVFGLIFGSGNELNDPNTPTISGGVSKVYGHETNTLTCSTTSTYPDGVTMYYVFESYLEEEGNAEWTSTPQTSSTYEISEDEFKGQRFYRCKVYASDGNETTQQVVSSNYTEENIINARVDFESNGGLINGVTPLYVDYGTSNLYSTKTEETATGTMPGGTKNGYIFNGWFTSSTGGSKVVNSDGTLVPSISGWTSSTGKWILTNPTDVSNTHKLYAQYSVVTPEVPTISGGNTKVYGNGKVKLTCTTSTTLPSSLKLYYSFGTSSSANGTYSNWTEESTKNTYDVPYNYDDSYYKCRVYVKDTVNNNESSTVVSETAEEVIYVNARLDFDANTNGGTLIGSNPVYVQYGNDSAFTARNGSTLTSTPIATKPNYTFIGWYTSANGGVEVIDEIGNLNSGTSGWVNSNGNWILSEIDDIANTQKLYAKFIENNSNNLTATFYYYDGTEVKTKTDVCTITSGSSCNVTVPSEVQNSTGVYGGTFAGVSALKGDLTSGSLNISYNQAFFAFYRTEVTNYYYDNSYQNRTLYRNEYFTSNSNMGVSLSTTSTGITNYDYVPGPNNATWIGLSTAKDTTVEYSTIEDAAQSSATTLYSVYRFDIEYLKGSSVTNIGSLSDSCSITSPEVRCSVILPSISAGNGYTIVGWSETLGDTTGEAALAIHFLEENTTLYANAVINNPNTPTIYGGTTKAYNRSETSITCSSSTTYASGTNKYYEFGYSSTTGGQVTWLGSPTTTQTLTVPKDEYRGTRYYSCRVYASDGAVSSTVVPSSSPTKLALFNARIDFDATTNGGTVSGTSPLYVTYNLDGVYTGRANSEASTLPTATKAGYAFNGWYTAASDGDLVIDASGNVIGDVSGWTNSYKYWILTGTSDAQNTNRLYAQFTGKTYTATFYYNTNTTSGELTVATVTSSCQLTSGESCTVTVPSEVQNSVGKYNGAYLGVSNSTSSLASGSLAISDDQDFYAYYTSPVTNYYYNNEYTDRTLYRNEFFTSNSAMGASLSLTNNTTSNYTPTTGPGNSTFVGLSTDQDTTAEYTIETAANSDENAFYEIYKFDISYEMGSNVSEIGATTANCNLVSPDSSCTVMLPSITPNTGYTSAGWGTNGATTGTPALGIYLVASNNQVLYANAIISNPEAPTISGGETKVYGHENVTLVCSSNSASGLDTYYSFGYLNESSGELEGWTTPSTTSTYEVPYSYDAKSYGCRVYLTDGTLTSDTVNSSTFVDTTYVNARLDFDAGDGTISGSSTLYVPYGSSNVYTTRNNNTAGTIPTASKTNFAFNGWYTSSTGGTKVIGEDGTIEAGVSGFTDENGKWLLTSTSNEQGTNKLYAQYTQVVFETLTATFYYNENNMVGVQDIKTVTAECQLISGDECTVDIPDEVLDSISPYSGAFVGVSSTVNSLNSSSLTISDDQDFYSFYSGEVINYYYDSEYTDRTIYRNEFFTSNSEMTSVLSLTYDGTTNFATSTGPNSSSWAGLSTDEDTNVEYATVIEAANSEDNIFYNVYEFNLSYEKGSNVSEIGASTGNCKITTSDTSCSVILPSITPKAGFTSVGWGTNGATTGLPALDVYLVESNDQVLYANAVINNPEVPIISGGATKVYGEENVTLTCTSSSVNGLDTYYSFGYTNELNGELGNYTTPSTTSTYEVPASYGTKYYGCRVYLTDGTSTSTIVSSSTLEEVTYVNARLDFDAGDGTISGSSTLYVPYGSSNVYTVRNNNTAGTIPSASKEDYDFDGWFTSSTGGSKVIGSTGIIESNVSGYTDNSGKWIINSISDEENTNKLYAQYTESVPDELTATFIYNSSTVSGELTVSTLTSTCALENNTSCTVTVPSEVQNSVGQYNSAYKGVVNVVNNMNPSDLTISDNTTFYAIYNSPVDRYYYNNGYKHNVINRNEFFTSNSEMNAVLATVDNGMNNYTSAKGPNSSIWVGLSEEQDTIVEYTSVSDAAHSSTSTIYTVYQLNINYQMGSNVNSIGTTIDSCRVTSSDTTCSVTLPSITPKPGFTVIGWGDTNGSTIGVLPGEEYTLEGNNRVLYANAGLNDPEVPTISGGEVKVNGQGTITLTCSTTSTYESGVNIYYSFGYSLTDGGTTGNYSTVSTTNTYEVPEFLGSRYYKCRIYASDGSSSTYTVTSEDATEVSIVNARVDFDANGGTLNGSSTLYVPYGASNIYNGRTSSFNATIPSVSRENYDFNGWYTSLKGGVEVIDASGNIKSDVAGWTDEDGKWILTNTSDEEGTNKLYAKYTSNLNEITATFYYYNGNAISSDDVTCEIASGASCTISIPEDVVNSFGKYNGTYAGVSRNTSSFIDGDLTIREDISFYAFYRSEVTNYYFDDEYTIRTLYRNEFFVDEENIDAVLSTTNTGVSNYTTEDGINSSVWVGLSTGKDTTVEYSTLASAANSTSSELYSVYAFNITYEKSPFIDVIGANTDSCMLTTDDESCVVMLPSITPKEGYTSIGWGELDATTGMTPLQVYLLESNDQVLYANAIINDPTSPIISSSGPKVYGDGVITLTCDGSNEVSGIDTYYSFGYTHSEEGTINNWTTPSTTNTLEVQGTYDSRYYACKVYLTDGTQTSNTLTSTSRIEVSYVNARIDFDANGETVSGSSTLYVPYGSSSIYTTRKGNTQGSIPKGIKRRWTFTGWYTSSSGGSKVINVDGTINPSVRNWTDSNGNFILTNTSDEEGTYKLYAQFIDEFEFEIMNYEVDESRKYISKVLPDTTLENYLLNIETGNNFSATAETVNEEGLELVFTGSRTTILKNDQTYVEYTNIVIGDINGDGTVNSADLLKIRQHLLEVITLEEPYSIAADINYDNEINSADLLRTRQHLLGTKTIE